MFGSIVNQILVKDITSVDWMPLLQDIDVVIHLAAIAHRGNDVAEATYDKSQSANHGVFGPSDREGRRKTNIYVVRRSAITLHPRIRSCPKTYVCIPAGGYGRSKLNRQKSISPLAAGTMLFFGQP